MMLVWLFVCIWPGAALAKVPVFVSILPQRYFVERIGGEHVDVQVMVLPGASPTTYEPKPRQMAAIAKAKIYFSMGVPFEAVWLGKIVASNKNLRIVPMDRGIQKLAMASFHSHDETEQRTKWANAFTWRRRGHAAGHSGSPCVAVAAPGDIAGAYDFGLPYRISIQRMVQPMKQIFKHLFYKLWNWTKN